jgi:ornithine cyclodeaminase
MRVVSAEDIDRVLTFPALMKALAEAFGGGLTAPPRHHHAIPRPDGEATLLLMPAWTALGASHAFTGVKIVSVVPGNAASGIPSIQGTYLLTDAHGTPLAALDGAQLTLWRTAAASALAARYLAPPEARRMVMIGAGALAPHLVRAHSEIRPLTEITIWSRRPEKARVLAEELAAEGWPASASEDLRRAVAQADLISCATLATQPILHGDWLKPGTHLDLVGAFRPGTRETDDSALIRSTLYIDTEAALTEGGDVATALASAVIQRSAIQGVLADLVTGRAPGRTSKDEITAFKSVGASVEDLAAAILVWRELPGARA